MRLTTGKQNSWKGVHQPSQTHLNWLQHTVDDRSVAYGQGPLRAVMSAQGLEQGKATQGSSNSTLWPSTRRSPGRTECKHHFPHPPAFSSHLRSSALLTLTLFSSSTEKRTGSFCVQQGTCDFTSGPFSLIIPWCPDSLLDQVESLALRVASPTEYSPHKSFPLPNSYRLCLHVAACYPLVDFYMNILLLYLTDTIWEEKLYSLLFFSVPAQS